MEDHSISLYEKNCHVILVFCKTQPWPFVFVCFELLISYRNLHLSIIMNISLSKHFSQILFKSITCDTYTDLLVMFSLCWTVTFVCSNKESPLYYCSVYKAAKFSCQLSTAGQTSARIHVQRPETEKCHQRKRGKFF